MFSYLTSVWLNYLDQKQLKNRKNRKKKQSKNHLLLQCIFRMGSFKFKSNWNMKLATLRRLLLHIEFWTMSNCRHNKSHLIDFKVSVSNVKWNSMVYSFAEEHIETTLNISINFNCSSSLCLCRFVKNMKPGKFVWLLFCEWGKLKRHKKKNQQFYSNRIDSSWIQRDTWEEIASVLIENFFHSLNTSIH